MKQERTRVVFDSRVTQQFKDCKLQSYEKGCSVISVWILACLPVAGASCWNKNEKKNSFKIIIGFFFTPPLFLATKVDISFVYCSPKNIKCTQKPKIFEGVERNLHLTRDELSDWKKIFNDLEAE